MRYAATWLFDGPDGQRDPARGVALLTGLAEHGSQEAAALLGLRLLTGGDVPTDFKAAARWLEQSERGTALLWLAVLHAKGLGVERNVERARELEEAGLESATFQDQVDFAVQLARAAPDVRDVEWALRVLDSVMSDANNRSPLNWSGLAVAYAALGRFAEAVSAQQDAIAELASDADLQRTYRSAFERRLAAYRNSLPAPGTPP